MAQFEEGGLIVATIDCKPGKGQGVSDPSIYSKYSSPIEATDKEYLKIVDLYTEFIKTIKPREPDCTHFILYKQADAKSGVDRFYTVEK